MADAEQLARIARVRAVQLMLARTAQAQAHAQVASETALSARIAQLAEAVAPAPAAVTGAAAGTGAAVTLSAAAYYRDRLHQSACTARGRVDVAEQRAARATDAAQAAERDCKAVEKLQARGNTDAALAINRALVDAPMPTRPFRHEAC